MSINIDMSWWSNLIGSESSVSSGAVEGRSTSLENPQIALDDERAWDIFAATPGYTGESVSVEDALGIPAVWAAINVTADAFASLPCHVFRKLANGERETVADNDPVQTLLGRQVNVDYLTSFQWRRGVIVQLLSRGRSLTWIERNRAGRPMNLYPLNVDDIEISRVGHRLKYRDRIRGVDYEAGEIIDLIWMPGCQPGSHRDPIYQHRNLFGGVIAADKFSARAFRNGGVSPLKLHLGTKITTPAGGQKATQAVSDALRNGGMVLPLFGDMDLNEIGFDAAKMQLLELKRFQVEEIARVFRIQPSKIHDNSRSTYSNSEQQGLAFMKDTIQPIVEQMEEELQAKLFSDKNRTHYVKFNMDGLTRGDLAARATAYASLIRCGIMTINEARAREDLPPVEGGDKPIVQGAEKLLEDLGKDMGTPIPADPNAQTNNEPAEPEAQE